VRDNSGCRPVHGWLVFDYEGTSRGLIPLVQFNPHTIVETDDGEGYDVTPSRASRRYPFLDHDGSREDFIRIVEGKSLVVFGYNPLMDAWPDNSTSRVPRLGRLDGFLEIPALYRRLRL
jgi:hypothetical protein